MSLQFLENKSIEILVCRKPIRKSLGLINHFFLIIPEKQIELHPGEYYFGSYHTAGFTKSYTVYEKFYVCKDCYEKLIEKSKKLSNIWYYPYVNCETLSRGLVGDFAISHQFVLFTLIGLSTILCFISLYFIILIVLLILLLIYINNFYYPLNTSLCVHLNDDKIEFNNYQVIQDK